MADASDSLHELPECLKPETIDQHRAIASLMEELEAVDWYDQRVDAASDDELRAILEHNRDEEKEHAAMVLEWLRRRDAKLDEHLRTYLFTSAAVLDIEEAQEAASAAGPGEAARDRGGAEAGGAGDAAAGAAEARGRARDDGSLGIGSLRAERGS